MTEVGVKGRLTKVNVEVTHHLTVTSWSSTVSQAGTVSLSLQTVAHGIVSEHR